MSKRNLKKKKPAPKSVSLQSTKLEEPELNTALPSQIQHKSSLLFNLSIGLTTVLLITIFTATVFLLSNKSTTETNSQLAASSANQAAVTTLPDAATVGKSDIATVTANAQQADALKNASATTVQAIDNNNAANASYQMAATSNPTTAATITQTQKVTAAYAKVPLAFETNVGQVDSQVKYLARGRGYSFYLTNNAVWLDLALQDTPITSTTTADTHCKNGKKCKLPPKPQTKKSAAVNIKMSLVGANSQAQPVGVSPLTGKTNYFVGNDKKQWHQGVTNYSAITYKNVYSGTDVTYYGNSQTELEYDFTLAAGADPNAITLQYDGADKLEIDSKGQLIVDSGKHKLTQHAPIIYQTINGKKQTVAGSYVLRSGNGKNQVGFSITGSYDHTQPLLIDPVLAYSTLFGLGNEYSNAIAIDNAGDAYITGLTNSANLTTTVGAYQPTYGGANVFVAELSADGSQLLYSTFLGGYGTDEAYGIALDSNKNVYLTGFADRGFPTTAGAYESVVNIEGDGFIAKLSADGSQLLYSTFVGGDGGLNLYGIALDSQNRAYVVGMAYDNTFTATTGTVQTSFAGGNSDAVVARLSADGSTMEYATYLGSSNDDIGYGIKVDSSNNAYVVGYTLADTTDTTPFPTTANAYQKTAQGNGDGFVAKLNASGSALVYSTLLGGDQYDQAEAIVLDNNNDAVVTGYTESDNFPVSSSAYQNVYGQDDDIFVTRLNSSGSGIINSTYFGTDSTEHGDGIAIDNNQNIYLLADMRLTSGSETPITTTTDAFQRDHTGDYDAVIAKFNSDLSQLDYSTLLGGSYDSIATSVPQGIAVDSNGSNLYVTSQTDSPDFPVTSGAYQQTFVGEDIGWSYDTYVAKFSFSSSSTITPTSSLILTFTVQPVGGQAGQPLSVQPVVAVENNDGSGTINTSYNGPITLTLKSGTGTAGATLSGTATLIATNGVVTYTNLSISTAGSGYVLTASGASPTVTTTTDSQPFTVTNSSSGGGGNNNTPAQITVISGTNQSASANTFFAQPLVAAVTNAQGQPVSGTVVTFTGPPVLTQPIPGGIFSGTNTTAITTTTDINGKATSPVFLAGTITGTFVVTATVSGVVTPASFVLTTTNPGPTVPATPNNVQVTAGNSHVVISWSPVSISNSPTITGFNLYRFDGSNTVLVNTVPIAATVYTDTNVVNGTLYTYQVTALNSIGESAYSAPASGEPAPNDGRPQPPILAQAVGRDQGVILVWSSLDATTANVTGYKVYRQNGSSWTLITPNPITATNYTDAGTTTGTYYVTALNSVGESLPSNNLLAPYVPQPRLPSSPTKLVAASSGGQVALSWQAPTDLGDGTFEGYYVYRWDNGFPTRLNSSPINATSYTDTTVTSGQVYRYTVRSVTDKGEGGSSNQVVARP